MIIGFDGSRAFGKEKGGTENYSYQLLKAMLKVDRKNKYLVYTRSRAEDPFIIKQANVWVRMLRWPKLWTQGGLALATWRDKLDVLMIPAHTLPVLRKPGIATMVTIHGLEYEYLPEHYKIPQKYYLTWSTRYAVRKASRLVAVSRFTKKELVERLGADGAKITVVHEGVEAERFRKLYKEKEKQRVLKKYGIKKPYILFVGVIQPRKNLLRLIEAFSLLTRTNPVNSNLVIAGKLGWMYEKILRVPKKFEIEERVKFTGFLEEDDLPVVFQEALVYVQPSLTEGFGLPILEAMASGTPVIAARSGALPELVGEAGLLVDPKDVEDISKAIDLALKHSELREGLREKGYKRVRIFGWEKAAKATLEVIEKTAEEQ